jgi:hypothetical protein
VLHILQRWAGTELNRQSIKATHLQCADLANGRADPHLEKMRCQVDKLLHPIASLSGGGDK